MKYFQYTFQFSQIIVALVVVYGVYLLIFPLKPGEIHSNPFPVLTPKVKAGESLKIYADFCLNTNATGKITRILKGDVLITLPPSESNLKKGCYKLDASIVMPKGTPPGRYILENRYEYQVNSLKRLEMAGETEEFEIIN